MNQNAAEKWTRELIAVGEYDRACAAVLTFFEVTQSQPPDLWDLLKQSFRSWLSQSHSSEQRVQCLESVLYTLHPSRHYQILKLIGIAECEKKRYASGNYYLSEAHRLAVWSASTFALLCSYRNSSVNRWHFRMLNDITRNTVFRNAIHSVVNSFRTQLGRSPVVLDIGMGTGLLGLYAVEAGATVIGCDNDKIMFSIAEKVIEAKGSSMSVQCCHSDNVVADSVDIILTETLDALGLGEYILESTFNACEKWSVFQCVPESLSLYSSLIQSDSLHSTHFLSNSLYNYRSSVGTEADRYDCEFAGEIEDLVWISAPTKILEVNVGRSLLPAETREISFVATVTGYCHGIMTYFDLAMCNNITLTSAPSSIPSDKPRASCWEQAFHPLPERKIEAGEAVIVSAQITSNSIIMTWADTDEAVKYVVLNNNEFWEVMGQNYAKCFAQVLNKLSGQARYSSIDGDISAGIFYTGGDVMYNPSFSLIVTPEGLLSDNPMYNPLVRSFQVYGCIIECPLLESWTKVDDKNTLGVAVSSLVNCYQTLCHQDLSWPGIPHTRLSEELLLLSSPVKASYTDESREDLVDQYCEGISTRTTFSCIRGGVATALVIWYNIDFFGDQSFCSLEEPTWKQSAILFVERPPIDGQCNITMHHKHGNVCVSELSTTKDFLQ